MEAVFFVIFLHFLSRFYTYDVFFPAYILVRWKERVSALAETSLLRGITAVRGGIWCKQ